MNESRVCCPKIRQTHTHTTMDDDAAWDDICVGPFDDQLLKGRSEGRMAGLESGYRDGETLGFSKGVELGLELGFMAGVCDELCKSLPQKEEVESKDRHRDKVYNLARELLQTIDSFPTPDAMFQKDDNGQEQQQQQDPNHDVRASMQRIRARFKLLMVRCKTPLLSLETTLADPRHRPPEKEQQNNNNNNNNSNEW